MLLEEAVLPQDGGQLVPTVLKRESHLVVHPLLLVRQPHTQSYAHMVPSAGLQSPSQGSQSPFYSGGN